VTDVKYMFCYIVTSNRRSTHSACRDPHVSCLGGFGPIAEERSSGFFPRGRIGPRPFVVGRRKSRRSRRVRKHNILWPWGEAEGPAFLRARWRRTLRCAQDDEACDWWPGCAGTGRSRTTGSRPFERRARKRGAGRFW